MKTWPSLVSKPGALHTAIEGFPGDEKGQETEEIREIQQDLKQKAWALGENF